MNIMSLGEYHLYLLTLELSKNKEKFTHENTEEAFFRTIINRAYYSSFLLSRYYLEIVKSKKLKTPNEFPSNEKFVPEHTQVIKLLNKKRTRKISSNLAELKNLRKKADYDFNINISEAESNLSIQLMNNIINNLKPLINV